MEVLVMYSKARFIVRVVMLIALALTVGSATAQQMAATSASGPCAPGASYDPACDVDQNGAINVLDIQLAADHWGQGGVWTSGSWDLTGNAGTMPGTHFLGTTDGQALELRVAGQRAMRLEPAGTSPNVIGGSSSNHITAGTFGATISGGGGESVDNRVTDHFGTVGGGANNQAGNNTGTTNDAVDATVAGGASNSARNDGATVGGGLINTASAYVATVAGGASNVASGSGSLVAGGYGNAASGSHSAVAGGYGNTAAGQYGAVGGGWANTAVGYSSTVGGGYFNGANGDHSTVGGGIYNQVTALYGTIAGGGYDSAGQANRVTDEGGFVGGGGSNQAGNNTGPTTDAYYSTVSGGWGNEASGKYAAVPGGENNTASGDFSFAAGHRANASNPGCFVWGDATNADVGCSTANRWIARSSGGVDFFTNADLTSGVYLSAGGSGWNVTSSRARKENFAPVNGRDLLERLAAIEISTWNYKAQDPTVRHIGPMADDFNAVLAGLGGEGQEAINSLDADGVALAAIQGLYLLLQEQQVLLAAQQRRIETLEASMVARRAAWRGLQQTGAPPP